MNTTTLQLHQTVAYGRQATKTPGPSELLGRYDSIVEQKRLSWTAHHQLIRQLGQGGQGIVYLSERRGADSFTLPVAIKVFSPARFESDRQYEDTMARLAHVASHVAQIQQDNLLDVHNFVDRDRIRMMVMEWVDGYDLRHLMSNDLLEQVRHRVSNRRWEYINRVVVTAGHDQPQMRPGVAVAVVRDCLAALAALHREGIVHGDVKPANIMLKCTGNAKIVDIGSAFYTDDPPPIRTCTPTYAAPEVLEGNDFSPQSDLASLGYVLIEMLSGRSVFPHMSSYKELLEAKRFLPQRLNSILPEEVTCNELLMSFCKGLIAPDPTRRFVSAEAADLVKEGAAAFLRQLVIGDLSVEYDNEIRLWLAELKEIEALQSEF